MLRLAGGQVESLFDEVLPTEVRELPEDLAKLDVLLRDPALLAPIESSWAASAREFGRPTIAMATYVRLMLVKQRSGWGYETLVREVSDSLHLRRFCLIGLAERVPDESTVRKLTRRLGPEVVAELTRCVIEKAQRETRFRARAVRIDSTVVEADVRYPSDAVLALQGAKALAREGRRLRALVGGKATRVRDRSRQIGKRVRQISRTLARRSGERVEEVLELNRQAADAMAKTVREARRLAAQARKSARGRGAQAKLRAAAGLDELAARCERIAGQIAKRLIGEPIAERIVSLSDPDARPIRKGKLGKPNEFGYVTQIAEVTANTRRGARGFVLPPSSAIGNQGENTLLAKTVEELTRLKLKPQEVALDGAFGQHKSRAQLEPLAPKRLFVSGREEPDSRKTRKRLQRYRTGAEGRISHLKRAYGLRRSRFRGFDGQQTWTGWAIFAYNLDTLAVHSG